jgi:hypothetical protein
MEKENVCNTNVIGFELQFDFVNLTLLQREQLVI